MPFSAGKTQGEERRSQAGPCKSNETDNSSLKIEAFLMVIDKIMLLLLPRNYRDILVVAMVESVNVLSL